MDTRLQLLCRLSRDECIGFFSSNFNWSCSTWCWTGNLYNLYYRV